MKKGNCTVKDVKLINQFQNFTKMQVVQKIEITTLIIVNNANQKDIKNLENHMLLMTLKYFLEIQQQDVEVVLLEVKVNLNVL